VTDITDKHWESVYSRNIGKMISICYRYTADRQLAEDLAHDAFLKAIDKAESFEGRGPFEAWLHKIAVNHALQYLRDQKKKQHADRWLRREQIHEPIPSRYHPEHSEQELLDAINTLPERHRLVFNLYVIDNYTHRQIGEELGISEGTSKSHLARARKKLRRLLTEKASQNKNRKKAFLLLFFPKQIDALYRHEFTQAPTVSTALVTWSTSVVTYPTIIATILFTPVNQPQQTQTITTTDITTATLSPIRVILDKNINYTNMKKRDSVGAIMLAATSILFDTTAQATPKKDTLSITEQPAPIRVTTPAPTDTARTPEPSPPSRIKQQHGTFTAGHLLWSSENHELYFKGTIRMDVGNNHFDSKGSVTILGPVYLVIVNDIPLEYDKTIKLSPQRHHLTTLTETEATQKYGEKGRHGAVEISTRK
jgi:RNA polymerase sigma factor (sigma-70 family)